MEQLKKLFSGNSTVCNLALQRIRRDNIAPKTVRTKGQYRMQRLFCILGGKAKYELTNKTILCEKGDILYLPPDVTYVCTWETEDEDAGAVLVQFDLFASGEKVKLASEMLLLCHDRDGSYREQLLRMHEIYTEGRFGYRLQCQAMALSLLHQLLTESTALPLSGSHERVQQAVRYVEDHYQHAIDVNALAKSCSLCPAAFRSKFHALTGMSPIEYKNMLAMEKAAELLRAGLYTVFEVSLAVGIEDTCYFNRLFKRTFGTPPGKYRNTFLQAAEFK